MQLTASSVYAVEHLRGHTAAPSGTYRRTRKRNASTEEARGSAKETQGVHVSFWVMLGCPGPRAARPDTLPRYLRQSPTSRVFWTSTPCHITGSPIDNSPHRTTRPLDWGATSTPCFENAVSFLTLPFVWKLDFQGLMVGWQGPPSDTSYMEIPSL